MTTFAFIDASNLFYGGVKSLGWKIDYQKLLHYLKEKYQVSVVLYFGGVETHGFPHDYLNNDTANLEELEVHLMRLIQPQKGHLNEMALDLLGRHLQRIRFYRKLQGFGYRLHLKPVKWYNQDDGTVQKKANCDVDMTFYLMKEAGQFDRAVVLSGDGDFLPVLKYLRAIGKGVFVLARGHRTAREIRQFVGGDFRDFVRLEKYIKFVEAET